MPDASTVQANVVAAVSADSGDHLGAVLDAVSAQVYEPSRVIVIGDAPAARSAAEGRGIDWYPNLRNLLDDLDREVSHVWLLHDDARPRPDALGALVTESIRVDASMADPSTSPAVPEACRERSVSAVAIPVGKGSCSTWIIQKRWNR